MAEVETGGRWYVEGRGPLEAPESIGCEVGEHGGEEGLALTGTVAGIPTEVTVEGVECVEATISDDAEGAGTTTGKLRLTGMAVVEPAGCSIEGGTVETEPLHGELYMDAAEPAITFEKLEPDEEAGATRLAIVRILGASCPVAGNKVLKGHLFGEASNLTGLQALDQPFTFSPEVDETAGSELTFGGNPGRLTGQVITRLSGTNAGRKFWTE